jgi:hypothetical protein
MCSCLARYARVSTLRCRGYGPHAGATAMDASLSFLSELLSLFLSCLSELPSLPLSLPLRAALYSELPL